jgi:hypothetical protein
LLGVFGIYGTCNRGIPEAFPAQELQELPMPEDMSFNKHVEVAPPPIPKKSSKGLIVGICVTLALLAAVAFGYHAGVFKPEQGAGNIIVKGDC